MRVVIDWSATRLEAALVGGADDVVDRIGTDDGLKRAAGRHEAILDAALAPWRRTHGSLHILAAGMVGGRSGWMEIGYVPAPASLADIARAARHVALANGDRLTLIPGLCDPAAPPFPDVMRGEEAQLVGHGLQRDAVVVMPGNNGKWARIGGGRIAGFRTFVTGELVALLLAHSGLAGIAIRSEGRDWRAFARGLECAAGPDRHGLLTRLFTARTGWLAGQLAPAEIGDYLRGLLIGWEFIEARNAGLWLPGGTLDIVGDDDRVDDYRRAAEGLGLTARVAPDDTALRGALAIGAESMLLA
ncbi:2-dehydro-3-deoxygalactonokinase [Devosia sp.]|uniref:2-dehydro-3-deoxygalactonokinase n=1 Tax=Devosia sp. TaxID=1871048 RepID=UPI002AFE0375|nr:2-dehydro-3-deoxygalactonokinase [Devosia sp.]